MNTKELQAENMMLREVIREQNVEIELLEAKLYDIEQFIERYINEHKSKVVTVS